MMLPGMIWSKGKLALLVQVIFLTFCLLLVASPGSAAIPQPQAQSESYQSPQPPTATCPPGGQCFADVPSSNPFYAFVNRIYQQDLVSGYQCGGAGEPCDSESRPYYRPANKVTRQQMAKFIDNARRLPEIHISVISGTSPISVSNDTGTAIYASSTRGSAVYGAGSTLNSTGVYGFSTQGVGVRGESGLNPGVVGESAGNSGVVGQGNGYGVSGYGNVGVDGHGSSGPGVFGESNSSYGVNGLSTDGVGVNGHSSNGSGVHGSSTNGPGIYGISTNNWAGYFGGNINVTGNCTGCVGPSKIDHPLDPENKYLYHSTVQSPDMKTIYDGNVTTDDNGEAEVVLPDYFEALNRDFRYQLTIMGDQFAQARISSKIKDNRFTIMTDKPNIEVSWQVTGIRQDPYANAHRTPVEEDKPADERGKYLHPTELGQPASLGVDYEEQQKMQQMAQQEIDD